MRKTLTVISILFWSMTSSFCYNANTNHKGNMNSNKAVQDSTSTVFIREYHKYKLKNQNRVDFLNWIKPDFGIALKLKDSELASSEFVQFTKEMYSKYYMNKIELYNYNNIAYIYLNLREAQNTTGAIQFTIPLSNFKNLLSRKNEN